MNESTDGRGRDAKPAPESRERETRLAQRATGEMARKAMAETVALAGRIGAGFADASVE